MKLKTDKQLIVLNTSVFTPLIEGFEENLRKEIGGERFVVIEIEDYRGSILTAAYIDTSEKNILKLDKTFFNYKYNYPINYKTFSLVAIDDDYLFGTEAPLIRLQANSEDSWLCKDLVRIFD